MKTSFNWYFSPTEEELNNIWENGILTVDTNVLLDLYRYHEDTRNSIIDNIEKFRGTKWLTFQAASEFFRNRRKVIISSEKTFKEALTETNNLSKTLNATVSQLKGNRIIPNEIAIRINEIVSEVINKAEKDINTAKENHPNFLNNDTILEKITTIFSNAVGSQFEDLTSETEKARVRKEKRIPPGYLDDDKDGDRPYGDYFLWRQVLNHAASEQKPIILVTSERKEDWWERISGKTTGPRPELLKEAREETNQHIIIYQTENFLKYSSERLQQPINDNVIEEIIEIGSRNEPATVIREHTIDSSSTTINIGTIQVELKRPVRNFTVSRKLTPHMNCAPTVTATLLKTPDNFEGCEINAATGTNYDFNVHIFSKNYQNTLPIGLYTFRYEASIEETEEKIIPINIGE